MCQGAAGHISAQRHYSIVGYLTNVKTCSSQSAQRLACVHDVSNVSLGLSLCLRAVSTMRFAPVWLACLGAQARSGVTEITVVRPRNW